ncbi:MAG: hypothetical protein KAG92_04575, partial [Deltaproteobacteria bacterium]|nr:hypothetical protein [Deltaproteobacteria bacterium]
FTFFKMSKVDEDWFSLELKASQTGIIDAEELAKMKKVMSDAQYEQEMECSFSAPVLGTYYAGTIETLEKKGQIAPNATTYNPAFPVFVATDLGYTDSTAFWFWQLNPDGVSVIRYYSAQGQPLQHYFDTLDSFGYEYETIWLPHDAKAKTLQTGRSTVEQFAEHYQNTTVNIAITPSLKVQHGIDAARLVLQTCWFNQVDCQEGIDALRSYRRQYDGVKQVFSKTPLHDWASGAADAFRYLALACKDRLKIKVPEIDGKEVNPSKNEAKGATLSQLFEERDRFLSNSRRFSR